MDDVVRVGVLQARQDPAQDAQNVAHGHAVVFPEQFNEGGAVDVLHLKHPADVLEVMDLVQGDDVRARQLGDEARLM